MKINIFKRPKPYNKWVYMMDYSKITLKGMNKELSAESLTDIGIAKTIADVRKAGLPFSDQDLDFIRPKMLKRFKELKKNQRPYIKPIQINIK